MEFNEEITNTGTGRQRFSGLAKYSKKVGGSTGTGVEIGHETERLNKIKTQLAGYDPDKNVNALSTYSYNVAHQQNAPVDKQTDQQKKFIPKPVIKPVVSQKKFTPKPVVEDNSDLEEQHRYSSVRDAKLHASAKSHFKPIPQPSDYEAPKAEPQKALNIHQSFEKNRPVEPPKLFKARLISHYNTLKANK